MNKIMATEGSLIPVVGIKKRMDVLFRGVKNGKNHARKNRETKTENPLKAVFTGVFIGSSRAHLSGD